MTPRKTPVLLRRGPVSGRVFALTRYSAVHTDVVVAARDGKHDVTADFDALALEELIGNDAPNIVGTLDAVADGETLNANAREQVRAFERRLRAMAERHNARIEKRGG